MSLPELPTTTIKTGESHETLESAFIMSYSFSEALVLVKMLLKRGY